MHVLQRCRYDGNAGARGDERKRLVVEVVGERHLGFADLPDRGGAEGAELFAVLAVVAAGVGAGIAALRVDAELDLTLVVARPLPGRALFLGDAVDVDLVRAEAAE